MHGINIPTRSQFVHTGTVVGKCILYYILL